MQNGTEQAHGVPTGAVRVFGHESACLSVDSTCTYLELPATKVTTASSIAAAGMAKPMVQLTLSCTYTRVVTARKEPRLMAK